MRLRRSVQMMFEFSSRHSGAKIQGSLMSIMQVQRPDSQSGIKRHNLEERERQIGRKERFLEDTNRSAAGFPEQLMVSMKMLPDPRRLYLWADIASITLASKPEKPFRESSKVTIILGLLA